MRKPAPSDGKRRKAQPVEVFKPNPAAWTTALILAKGDATRLKALDANTILIKNHGR